jgi:F0F1-type ATP synthase assembly protein I
MVFQHITVGLQLAVTILIFVYGGYWLDGKFDKRPLFLAIGTVLGMTVGFYNLLKELKAIQSGNNDQDDESERKGRKWL